MTTDTPLYLLEARSTYATYGGFAQSSLAPEPLPWAAVAERFHAATSECAHHGWSDMIYRVVEA